MSNRGQHNAHQHNASGVTVAAPAQSTSAYRMELWNDDGLAAFLFQWYGGRVKQEVNLPSELSVDFPYSADLWASLTFRSRIKLYNDRGALIDTFVLEDPERSIDTKGKQSIHVAAKSYLGQLAEEMIPFYESGNEQQTLTIVSATAGTFTLRFRGYVTSAIAYNASAATIQAALEALTSIGSGNVSVTGADGGPWVVEFAGALANTNVPTLTARGASLTGTKRVKVETTRATQTVAQMVTLWLNSYQTQTNPVVYGFIDADLGGLTRTIKCEGKSILAALQELQGTVGGYMWVDPDTREFHWQRDYNQQLGQFVRVGINGNEFHERRGDGALITRVLAVGAGDTYESALKATWNSPNQGDYGIRQQVVYAKHITTQEDLNAYAQAYGESLDMDRRYYEIGVVDLARLTSGDYSAFDLSVGSSIWAACDSFGVTIDTVIASIERDLDNPLNIKISVTDPAAGTALWGKNSPGSPGKGLPKAAARDATDSIADMLDMILSEQQDTGLRDGVADVLPDIFANPSDGLVDSLAGLIDDISQQGLGGGSGGALGTDDPENISITSTSPGTNPLGSHQDHVHQLTMAGTGGDPINNNPETPSGEPIGKVHSHYGIQLQNAATKAALANDANVNKTAIGFVPVTGGGATAIYVRNDANNGWASIHRAQVVANYAGLDSSALDGDLAYCASEDRFYKRENGTWRIDGIFMGTSTPSSVGERAGDVFFNTSTGKGYIHTAGSFQLFTHWA